MATTPWLSPGTIISSGSYGGTFPWSNPSNIAADDGSYADSSGFVAGDYTESLICTNFNAGSYISAGATLDGIECAIRGLYQSTDSVGGVMNAERIQLCASGFVTGGNKATGIFWEGYEIERILGGAADKWSSSWTRADAVNSSNGVLVQCFVGGFIEDGVTDALMDSIFMRFTYTPASSNLSHINGQSSSGITHVNDIALSGLSHLNGVAK